MSCYISFNYLLLIMTMIGGKNGHRYSAVVDNEPRVVRVDRRLLKAHKHMRTNLLNRQGKRSYLAYGDKQDGVRYHMGRRRCTVCKRAGNFINRAVCGLNRRLNGFNTRCRKCQPKRLDGFIDKKDDLNLVNHDPFMVTLDEEEPYFVRAVVDDHMFQNKRYFTVQWENYPDDDTSEETEATIGHTLEFKRYMREKHPDECDYESDEGEDEEAEEEFEVEKIKNHILHRDGTRSFKVRWAGYDKSYDTFEPEAALAHLDVLGSYLKLRGLRATTVDV